MKDGSFVGLDAEFIREVFGHQRAIVRRSTIAIQVRVVLEIQSISSKMMRRELRRIRSSIRS